MNKMKNGWRARTPREQRLILLAGSILFSTLIFSAWQQLDQWRDRQRLAFIHEKRAIAAIMKLESQLPAPQQKISPEEIRQRASEYGLKLELTPTPNGYTLAMATQVDFQPLVQWLTQLESCCALRARHLVYERRDDQRILTALELAHDE